METECGMSVSVNSGIARRVSTLSAECTVVSSGAVHRVRKGERASKRKKAKEPKKRASKTRLRRLQRDAHERKIEEKGKSIGIVEV